MIATSERALAIRANLRVRDRQHALAHPRWPGPYAMACALNQRWEPARHLQQLDQIIVEALAAGDGRLILELPPRHGKSTLVSHYLTPWLLLSNPAHRTILASYEASFAATWGRRARAVAQQIGVAVAQDSQAAAHWETAEGGGMTTAGVGGPITGRGADLLVIDDPVKNSEEAHSITYRDRAGDWWESTASTRVEPGGSVIVIMTRWHLDDLVGRLRERERGLWRIVTMPALTDDGEALWPERWPASRLEAIRAARGSYWWAALYQQAPTTAGAGTFRREWFRIVAVAPVCETLVRYWDLAGTEAKQGSDPDWTVGLLMGRNASGFVVLDVRRIRGRPAEVQALVKATTHQDGPNVHVRIEQEPGSSGLNTIDTYVRLLAGYDVSGDRVTGDKALRASPCSAQAEAGNVSLVRAAWNEAYLRELEEFPHGAHDDQVDASSGAFAELAPAEPGGFSGDGLYEPERFAYSSSEF